MLPVIYFLSLSVLFFFCFFIFDFLLGFQMHARFPLIARIRDHYTWIPKINMAVAVH